jgi:pyridoxine/pyridoxamine 5'-phosphate oxidase
MSRMFEFNRGENFMLRQQPEQRDSARTPVCLSATASLPGTPHRELVALIRDVSESGVMFYVNFPANAAPEIGTEIGLKFGLPIQERPMKVRWSGRVVRLVRYPTGAATGVALRLDPQQSTEVN